MIHIKRDGGWLCKQEKKWYNKHQSHISFTEAHRRQDMKGVCEDCLKEYYRRLERMPVVVVDYKHPKKKKKPDGWKEIEISDQLAKKII